MGYGVGFLVFLDMFRSDVLYSGLILATSTEYCVTIFPKRTVNIRRF